MNTRKIVVALLVGAIILPSISFAQTTTTVSPSRDETVLKLIASLMEQIKVLQAQLANLQKNNASSTVTTSTASSTANYGKPYLAKDGNWYYPKAYDANGKKLIAPTPLSAKIVTLSTREATTTSLGVTPQTSPSTYSSVETLKFEVLGKGDTFNFNSLVVRFNPSGTLKITDAYLYQGDKTPIASAEVVKNIATFNIPTNTDGAKIGQNIPTEYTIKASVTGLSVQNNLQKCPGTYTNQGRLTSISPGYRAISNTSIPVTTPAAFKVSLSGDKDIKLSDSAGNVIPVKGLIERSIQISAFESLSNICWYPGYREA